MRVHQLSNPALGLAGISLFVFTIYATSLGNPFQYDDAHSIVDNRHIQSLANIPSFFADPTMFSEDAASAMYRPLILVSYGLNHALGGYEPEGYHLVNLFVHLANLVLVYVLVRLLGRSSIQAFVAAAVFGVHPINSEAVNYVSSRSESISALFFLGALAAYIHGSRTETTRGNWQVVSLLAYAGALLSKSVAITLPVILGCYELAFKRQQMVDGSVMNRISRLHWPFWALSVVYLGMSSGAVSKAVFAEPVRAMDVQLATQAKALPYYALLLTMPTRLGVDHQFSAAEINNPVVIIALAALLSLGALAWCNRGRWSKELLWVAWPAIVLLPGILVPLNVFVNEHWLYLSSVAFAICVGFALFLVVRESGKVGAVCVFLLLITLGALSQQRSGVWENEERLWADALSKGPMMPRPHIYMGDFYARSKDAERALEEYRIALSIYPAALTPLDRVVAYNNMGAAHLSMGNFAEAIELYGRALQIDSTYAKSREALEGLLAIQAKARNPDAVRLRKRGLALMLAGDLRNAVVAFSESLELEVAEETLMSLALAYERMEEWSKAVSTLRVLRIASKNPDMEEAAASKIRRIDALLRSRSSRRG